MYIQLGMEFCVQDVVENVISQICIFPNVCVDTISVHK